MADGRLKIGSSFLKIGGYYLRIGPAPAGLPFFPVKQNFSDTTDLDMSFAIPGSNDAILILAVHAPQTSVDLSPTFVISGDLTWTEIASSNNTYTVLGDDYGDTYFWYWAALPSGTSSPVSVTATISSDPGLGGIFGTLVYFEDIDMVSPINNHSFLDSGSPSDTVFDGGSALALPSLGWYYKDRPIPPDDVVDNTYLPGPSDQFSDGTRWGLTYADAADPTGGSFPLSNAYAFYNLVGGTFQTTITSPIGVNLQRTFMIQLNPA